MYLNHVVGNTEKIMDTASDKWQTVKADGLLQTHVKNIDICLSVSYNDVMYLNQVVGNTEQLMARLSMVPKKGEKLRVEKSTLLDFCFIRFLFV